MVPRRRSSAILTVVAKTAMRAAGVYVVVAAVTCVGAQDISNSIDVRTLSELSLEQLLSVRSEFHLPINEEIQDALESREEESSDNHTSISGNPIAMALRRSKPKTLKRGGWEDEKSKKGIGSIFQMSITTLAFLAFGGYLLCLIVQSLKDKGGGYQKKIIVITPSSTAAPVTMAMFRRRRRRRRPVRIRRPQRQKRDVNWDDEGETGPTVDMTPQIDTEKMLDALVSLSEAYTRYHTVDYRRYNQTIIHF